MSENYQYVTEQSMTVVVNRDPEAENYEIIATNPLTDSIEFKTTTSWLKIDGVGMATSSLELSEHNTRIGITTNGNIELDV